VEEELLRELRQKEQPRAMVQLLSQMVLLVPKEGVLIEQIQNVLLGDTMPQPFQVFLA
jgi:hypothetical protein